MMSGFNPEQVKFLQNNHLFMFDESDPDEIAPFEYKMSVNEIMAVTWLRHLRYNVVELNKSLLAGFGGGHRSGKSLTACTIAYCIDATFWPRMKKRIVQTPTQLMDEVNYIKKNRIHGACIVIDEGGVVTPSDSFFEEWYKTLNQAIQVMGFLNPIIFWCAVIRDNIGAKFRKLFMIQIKAKRFSLKESSLKILELDYDDMRNKTNTKRPRVRVFGRRYVMNRMLFGRPPKFIEKDYRALTEPMKSIMLDKFGETMQEQEKKAAEPKRTGIKSADIDVIGIAKQVIERIDEFRVSSPGKRVVIDAIKIKRVFNISFQGSTDVKREAERALRSALQGQGASP